MRSTMHLLLGDERDRQRVERGEHVYLHETQEDDDGDDDGIIIGLQKYGFSLNWQTISAFFWIYPIDNEHQAIDYEQQPADKKRDCK